MTALRIDLCAGGSFIWQGIFTQSPKYRPSAMSYEENNNSKDRYRDEVYSLRVPAGKRTYFFDVKTTRSGEDFFLTITESKRVSESRYEKHKIFLYKEDFAKFVISLAEAVDYVRDRCLPDFEFRGLPDLQPLLEAADELARERNGQDESFD